MRELLVESPRDCGYRNMILVDEMTVGGMSCESYGVRVTGPDGECAEIPNITVSAGRIDELVDLLRRNQVSPVSLRHVVDDWL